VHGAFVDGSGWRPVYRLLTRDGFRVTIVQEPLTSLDEDVAAVRRVIALQDGPCVLVGHSYGGTVVTEAGIDPKVASLVYIAAHQPSVGESESANTGRLPALGQHPLRTPDGFLYLDPLRFPIDFAADLPHDQAVFEAKSQQLTAAGVFTTHVSVAAWKTKPSWTLVAGSDRIINPDLERMYARRAHSHVVEVSGASHSVYESHPKEVAALIEEAAKSGRAHD
jgi:pimeloyl-ACP methyl ester carboxylesterase